MKAPRDPADYTAIMMMFFGVIIFIGLAGKALTGG